MTSLRGWFFLALLLTLLIAPPSLAQVAATVPDISNNPDRYDGQTVSVTGTIAAYRERVSRAGNPYTTFRLEGGGASVAVFAWKHQGLRDGLQVRVTGKFAAVKKVGRYELLHEKEFTVNRARPGYAARFTAYVPDVKPEEVRFATFEYVRSVASFFSE